MIESSAQSPSGSRVELSFTCRHCARHCLITRHRLEEQVFFRGGACHRWEDERAHGEAPLPGEDLAAARVRLWRHHAGLEVSLEGVHPRELVGLPRALFTPLGLPLWTSVARATGRRPVLSEAATAEGSRRGQALLPDTSCPLAWTAMGQVLSLLEQGVERVLMPSWEAPEGACAEGWAQLEAQVQERCACPHVHLEADPWSGHEEAAGALGISRGALGRALQEGIVSMHRLRRDLQALGRPLFDELEGPLAVLLSPGCGLSDPETDQALTRELEAEGLTVIPMDCLPLERVALGARWQPHTRRLGRDLVRALALCHEDRRLLPVVVLGPDCAHESELLPLLPRVHRRIAWGQAPDRRGRRVGSGTRGA